MLRQMRADFKKYSWTLWLVIIAFLIGFSFTDPFRGGPSSETDLVSFADETITGQEYQDQLLKTLQFYANQTQQNKLTQRFINQLRIPEQVLQNMIGSIVIRNEADHFGIKVSDAELFEKISNYAVTFNDEKEGQVKRYIFRENGRADGPFIGIERYKALLARYYQTRYEEFEQDLKKEIVSRKLMNLVTGSLVIDEETLREKYRLDKDQAELEYIILKTDRIKQEIASSDEELQVYYEENKQDFKSPEKRKGNVIAYKFDDFKKEIKISGQELFDYFKKNKRTFVIPEKIKVSRIFLKYDEKNKEEVSEKAAKLKKELTPENFAQKAKEFSEDAKAKDGGDYGYWAWKNLDVKETSVIENAREKEIAGPIDSGDGFAILYVAEKVEESQEPFDKVRDRIKDTIEREKLEVLVTTKLARIYNKLKDEKNIKPSAEKMGLEVLETEPLTSSQSIKDLDQMGYIARRLFSLKEGEIGFPVKFLNVVAMVQLTEIVTPTVEPFGKVKDRVKEKLGESKKVALLEKEAAEISKRLNTLQDDKTIEEFLKSKELSASPVTYKRGNRLSYLAQKKDLDETIFSLEEKRYSPPLKFDKEVVIVKVKSRQVTGESDFARDKAEFYQQEVDELRNSFFNSYLSKAREDYELEFFNQELFDKIKDYIVSRFKE